MVMSIPLDVQRSAPNLVRVFKRPNYSGDLGLPAKGLAAD